MTGGGTLVWIVCIRVLLLVGAYHVLPWLVGEAKYVSLETETTRSVESMTLPNVAHARSRTGSGVERVMRMFESWMPKSLSSASILFCISAEESLTIVCLAVLERMQADVPWLLFHWHMSLPIVILLIIFVLPLCACILLSFGSGRRQWSRVRGMLSASLFLGWCFLFLRVPLPKTESTLSFFQAMLSRTAVLGVSLIAALSGSVAAGAICDSYEMMIRRRQRNSETDLKSMRSAFQQSFKDIQERRAMVAEVESERETSPTRGDWMRFLGWGSKDRQLSSLNTEIAGLVTMAHALRKDIQFYEEKERRMRYAKTWIGYAWIVSGYIFSMYCAMRLVQCVLNLLIFGYNSISTRDLVSTSVAHLLRLMGWRVDVSQWSPSISVLLLGSLIVMRTRVILGSLSAFIQYVSTGISTQILVLFTAQVLCIYVLAALIQLHAGVSLGSTGEPSRLLAALPDFQRVFGRIFDIIFLGSAVLVAAYRWFVSQSDASLQL